MLDRGLNAPLLGPLFLKAFFVLKSQVECQQRYLENSVTDYFLGILPKSFKIATFQNSWRLLQMLPEIIDLSLISLLNFL